MLSRAGKGKAGARWGVQLLEEVRGSGRLCIQKKASEMVLGTTGVSHCLRSEGNSL